MKLTKTGFLFLFFSVLLVACMNSVNDGKNGAKSHQMNSNQPISGTSQNMSTSMRQDYARWGKIALERTRERYPDSTISDYQYDTRRVNADGTVIDFFDFIVSQHDIEKDIKVKVLHNASDGKLISVAFEEIS